MSCIIFLSGSVDLESLVKDRIRYTDAQLIGRLIDMAKSLHHFITLVQFKSIKGVCF